MHPGGGEHQTLEEIGERRGYRRLQATTNVPGGTSTVS
jgi:hypothetical protein